jgi:hypothetical protein
VSVSCLRLTENTEGVTIESDTEGVTIESTRILGVCV